MSTVGKVALPLSQDSSFEEFPPDWYALADKNHFWVQARLRWISYLLRAEGISFDQPLRVLDIGSGHGLTLELLKGFTRFEVAGIDMNEHAVKFASENGRNVSRYDIFDRAADKKEAFDVILLLDVIEHIEHQEAFLEAACFHLKKGGLLLVNVPSLPLLFSKYDIVVGHIRRYTKKSLTQAIERSKMQVSRVSYWGFFFVPILMLRKVWMEFSGSNIVEEGFKPPSNLAHQILRAIAWIDSALRVQPFGTSLILTAKKRG